MPPVFHLLYIYHLHLESAITFVTVFQDSFQKLAFGWCLQNICLLLQRDTSVERHEEVLAGI